MEAFLQAVRDWATLLILGATVWATIYGPTRVYNLQQKSEEKRELRRRQYRILHDLMRTRAFNLHHDHVMAINLIQLEFYGHEQIQAAFKRYREHLDTSPPEDVAARDVWYEDRQDRFYTMIKAMADVLGFEKFDKSDLRRLSYTPQGWANEQDALRMVRGLTIDVLSGRRPVPVTQFHASAMNSKFPQPPGPTSLPQGFKSPEQ